MEWATARDDGCGCSGERADKADRPKPLPIQAAGSLRMNASSAAMDVAQVRC